MANSTIDKQIIPAAKPARLNFVALVAGGLALMGFLQAARALTALWSPLILDYCEMMVGGAAEQLRADWQLQAMYQPPAAPYGMPGVQYPPIFILLVATVRTFSGAPVLLVERLLAWAFYVGSAALIGLCVWQETRQKWLAVVAAGWPFCFWNVIIFAHAARVDPAALFCSLCAAWLYRRSRSSTTLVWVAFLSVLAFFTKQTYLAISAAIFFDLLLKTFAARPVSAVWPTFFRTLWHKPALLIYTAASLGWLLAGGLLFGVWSGGTFLGIFEPGRAGSFIFDKAPEFVRIFLVNHLPLLLLAGLGIRLQLKQRNYFWPLYSLFAALMCLTIVKDGAVDYYFNELSYVLSFSVAVFVAHYANLEPGAKFWTRWRHPALWLTLQLVVAVGMFFVWSHWKDFNLSEKAYTETLQMVQQAQAEQRPALILVDAFLLATDRPEQIGDYFIYATLLKNKLRSAQPLLNDLRAGRYAFILVESFVRWPPEVEAALTSRYNLRTISADDKRSLYHLYQLKIK